MPSLQVVYDAASSMLRVVPPGTWPAAASSRAVASRGTARPSMRAATPLWRAISWRWPRSPNPVMSVQASTPTRRMTRAAVALRVVMDAMAAATTTSSAASSLMAVAMMPVPSGLVRTSRSPGRAVEFRMTAAGSTWPTAQSPYLGSGSSMEWPPMMTMPACRAMALPPSRIRSRMPWPSSFRGKATRLSAVSGRPPMA